MSAIVLSASTPRTTNFFSLFNPHQQLEQRVSDIARQALPNGFSQQQMNDLKQSLRVAHSWSLGAGRMQKILSTIPRETIKSFILEIMTEGNVRDIEYYFRRCLDIFNEEALLDLSNYRSFEAASASYKSRGLTKANALKLGYEKEALAIWKEFAIDLKYFIHQILEVLLSITGIQDLGRKKHSRYNDDSGALASYEASAKLELYLKLIGYPATIYGLCYSLTNFTAPAIALTIVIIVSTLTFLVAYNRYWKPCPLDHDPLTNLTLKLLRDPDPTYPRKDILRKIQKAFESKKGVILRGDRGTGKSKIVDSFVQQILDGKICNFIKNPQVFSCNAADLGSGIDNTISSIESRFRRYKDQVVFFLDEFHTLFERKDKIAQLGSDPAERIKTFCDEFRYVIAATTKTQYDDFIKQHPTISGRRFEVIDVEPMSRGELHTALSQHLEGRFSRIKFDPKVIDYIIDNANKYNPNTSEVDAAFAVLSSAIQKMTTLVNQTAEDRVAKLEDEYGVLDQALRQADVGSDHVKMNDLIRQLEAKNTELNLAKQELRKIQQRAAHIQKMESYLQTLKRQSSLIANSKVDLVKNSALARSWMELNTRIAVVAEFIAKERGELGFPKSLDKGLIDEILKERVQNVPKKPEEPQIAPAQNTQKITVSDYVRAFFAVGMG